MRALRLLTILVLFTTACLSQSRSNRLFRPCPASTTRAIVDVERDGDISLVPCPGRSVFINGSGTSGLITSLNGLTTPTQTFAAPIANDTASWSSATSTHTLGLPITAITGATRTNFFPFFNAQNTFAKSPFSWDGTSYLWRNTALGGEFPMLLTPSASPNGFFSVGDTSVTSVNYFVLNESSGVAILSAAIARIGNASISGLGTQLTVTDSTKTFAFATADQQGIINLGGIVNYQLQRTITAAGTTGNRTINLPAGTVNFAAGTSAITVTNSTVNSTSIIYLTKRTNDATCDIDNAVAAAGSFVINMTANCTAETSVGFIVTN